MRPGGPERIPIWREGRAVLEALDLRRGRGALDRKVPRGDGRPLLLIPGYLAGDRSLAPLAGWLRNLGYSPHHAAITANVDCATRTAERLVERLKTITAAQAGRVVIIGHSLGGVLGRVLAVRRPDLVSAVVCLGSPLLSLNAVHPLVWASVWLTSVLGDLGIPGLFSRDCLSGACCAETRRQVVARFPDDVAFVSIYSRRDGVVNWRACLDPGADHVEVDSSHTGMAVNAAVYRELADRLALLGDTRLPRKLRAVAA